MKVLLLENISSLSVNRFSELGFSGVEKKQGTLSEEELCQAIKEVNILGIRSRTKITPKVLDSAKKLLAIGCFGVGTNQVDLSYARQKGVAVFNAPFSSTRSVAELVIGQMIMLFRHLGDKNTFCHAGRWDKSASGSHEFRGKKIGIVGYGLIGSQVGIMAETLGMHVVYYDAENKLPLGNAKQVSTLEVLVAESDVVTVHVPGDGATKNIISADIIAKMKKGARLINSARGTVVDMAALKVAIESGHVAGVAMDVFPKEPSDGEEFVCDLRGLPNVVLTPHIGGSTEEAQSGIALEVTNKLIKYVNNGSTTSSVNFPDASLPAFGAGSRLVAVIKSSENAKSVVGVLEGHGLEVLAQFFKVRDEVSYLSIDVGCEISDTLVDEILALDGVILARKP